MTVGVGVARLCSQPAKPPIVPILRIVLTQAATVLSNNHCTLVNLGCISTAAGLTLMSSETATSAAD